MTLFRCAALVMLSTSLAGCLVARVPLMIEAHQAEQRFPAKGQIDSAQPRTLISGGLQRRYWVQVPAAARKPLPVVLVLHGGTETAEAVWGQTSLPTLGARDGFIVAAPQGVNKHWNDGRGSTLAGDAPSTADDVAFLRAVIADLVLRDGADARSVFVIGASNGGFMALHFACQAPDALRAGANVISTLPTAEARRCKPAPKPLPWMSMNGVRDPLVPFAGMAEGEERRGEPQPALLSADATFQFLAQRAGCTPEAQISRIGGSVEKRVRRCNGGATAEQYVFSEAGHVWPGLPIKSPMLSMYLGGANLDVDTGEAAWDFFRRTLAAR